MRRTQTLHQNSVVCNQNNHFFPNSAAENTKKSRMMNQSNDSTVISLRDRAGGNCCSHVKGLKLPLKIWLNFCHCILCCHHYSVNPLVCVSSNRIPAACYCHRGNVLSFLFFTFLLLPSPVCVISCYNKHTKPSGMLMHSTTLPTSPFFFLCRLVTYDCPI